VAGEFGGETAAFYARFRRGYPAAFTVLLTQALRLGPADALADVGCGSGQLTLPLARQVRAVAGVDPESDMLALARQVAAEQGVTNVTWVAGTDRELPGLAELLGAPALAAVTIANAIHLTSAPDRGADRRAVLGHGAASAATAGPPRGIRRAHRGRGRRRDPVHRAGPRHRADRIPAVGWLIFLSYQEHHRYHVAPCGSWLVSAGFHWQLQPEPHSRPPAPHR
jgi:SAM-dependent methyltransferase